MLLAYLLEHQRYAHVMGIGVIFCIALLLSYNRRAIKLQLVLNAFALQWLIGFVLLRTQAGFACVQKVADGITVLYQCADAGSSFVFGSLTNPAGPWGFLFAFRVLPIIIFFGALLSLLFYYGIVQRIVYLISYIVQPLLGTSGTETLVAIANSFLGQTEAPLLIRNYLNGMSSSEMFVVMVSGMGTISGSILAVFVAMGIPAVHLLTASIMAIPSTLLIAKIMHPETEKINTAAPAEALIEETANSPLEAIARGTTDGLYLALNVGAMLIAFNSLIALINIIIGYGDYVRDGINVLLHLAHFDVQVTEVSLRTILGFIFAPFAYFLGFTGSALLDAGQLLGIKMVVNELVAYERLLSYHFSGRAVAIITYALCGFANFSCIGIQIGGIGSLVPEKRPLISQLGMRAVLGATLANLLSAMVVGILL